MVDPTIQQEQRQQVEEIQALFIDTTGEVVDETHNPLEEIYEEAETAYVSAIAPGSALRTWGPPVALAVVVLGAVWWLRK